jgi:hypothetical protein
LGAFRDAHHTDFTHRYNGGAAHPGRRAGGSASPDDFGLVPAFRPFRRAPRQSPRIRLRGVAEVAEAVGATATQPEQVLVTGGAAPDDGAALAHPASLISTQAVAVRARLQFVVNAL